MNNEAITGTDYWGGCPKCGNNDGFFNLSRRHWFFCAKHRVRWLEGKTCSTPGSSRTRATGP
jgi:hypothetical protein